MFSVKCKYHHMQCISSLVQLYQPQQPAPILCTICTIVKESEENGIQLLCYSGTEGSLQVIKFYTIDYVCMQGTKEWVYPGLSCIADRSTCSIRRNWLQLLASTVWYIKAYISLFLNSKDVQSCAISRAVTLLTFDITHCHRGPQTGFHKHPN